MLMREATARLTQSELAHLGSGEVAYIRKNSLRRSIPQLPGSAFRYRSRCRPLGALRRRRHADSSDRQPVQHLYKAAEDELKTVSLH